MKHSARLPRQTTRRTSGFSLVELTIAVLIMGILASVATPRFASMLNHYRADAAAAHIASDLHWARQHARKAGKNQSVSFTLPSSYVLTGMSDPDHPSQSYSVDLSQTEYDATIVSASFDASLTVTFDLYGKPLAGSPLAPLTADGTVVISCGSESRTITVNATTGKVSVS